MTLIGLMNTDKCKIADKMYSANINASYFGKGKPIINMCSFHLSGRTHRSAPNVIKLSNSRMHPFCFSTL